MSESESKPTPTKESLAAAVGKGLKERWAEHEQNLALAAEALELAEEIEHFPKTFTEMTRALAEDILHTCKAQFEESAKDSEEPQTPVVQSFPFFKLNIDSKSDTGPLEFKLEYCTLQFNDQAEADGKEFIEKQNRHSHDINYKLKLQRGRIDSHASLYERDKIEKFSDKSFEDLRSDPERFFAGLFNHVADAYVRHIVNQHKYEQARALMDALSVIEKSDGPV